MSRFPWWWLPLVVILFVVPLGIWKFIALSPQTTLCLASGRAQGAYSAFARKYIKALGKKGISVTECRTPGSVRNLELLVNPSERSGTDGDCTCAPDVALVQAGVASTLPEGKLTNVKTLMSPFHELVWVFYRKGAYGDPARAEPGGHIRGAKAPSTPPEELRELVGRRIGIGEEGSGTRALAESMLHQVLLSSSDLGIKPLDCDAGVAAAGEVASQTHLVACTNTEATDRLLKGTLDAAFFVVHPGDQPYLKNLLHNSAVDFMSFRRAQAYASLFPYLIVASVPEGVLDMVDNLPAQDKTMLAVPANLVGHSDLQEDLIRWLIRIVTRTDQKRREQDPRFVVFPWGRDDAVPPYSDLPLSEAARHWFNHGDTWLERNFRYVDAVNLKRIFEVMPLILVFGIALTLLFPLRHRAIHGRFYGWYKVLREVEQEIESLQGTSAIEERIRRVEDLEREAAASTRVPEWALGELYDVRVHIRMVLSHLDERKRLVNRSSREA